METQEELEELFTNSDGKRGGESFSVTQKPQIKLHAFSLLLCEMLSVNWVSRIFSFSPSSYFLVAQKTICHPFSRVFQHLFSCSKSRTLARQFFNALPVSEELKKHADFFAPLFPPPFHPFKGGVERHFAWKCIASKSSKESRRDRHKVSSVPLKKKHHLVRRKSQKKDFFPRK